MVGDGLSPDGVLLLHGYICLMRNINPLSGLILLVLSVFLPQSSALAQPFTSYFTGSQDDVQTAVLPGVVLMGGATESDAAMQWFLQRSGGGDIVVIRSTGADGYNDYFYSELGVSVNSVETLIIASDDAAHDPYVDQQIRNAEALWIAGGDQWNYVSYWKDSPVEAAIQYLINDKGVTIGGTSAGMAILGQAYFSAQNGTVQSASALGNPFNSSMTLGYNDFLQVPYLENTITDTHYDNPDRRGRHAAFMAWLWASLDINPRGIAAEEYTAICVNGDGVARVFGDYPLEEDYAWFIRPNCEEPWEPEACLPQQPLEWNRNQRALVACRVPGTPQGTFLFDLSNWTGDSSLSWNYWYIQDGQLSASATIDLADCLGLAAEELSPEPLLQVYPNPGGHGHVHFTTPAYGKIMNAQGALVHVLSGETTFDPTAWPCGLYVIRANDQAIRWMRH